MTEVSISLQAVLQTINWNATVYWRNDKIRQLLTPLVAQINVSVRFHDIESKSVLTDCLLGMAEVITDDNLLKSLNIDILMNTRSEDPRLRAQALACSEAMWRSHGGKLLGEKNPQVHCTSIFAHAHTQDSSRKLSLLLRKPQKMRTMMLCEMHSGFKIQLKAWLEN